VEEVSKPVIEGKKLEYTHKLRDGKLTVVVAEPRLPEDGVNVG
jgi:hypothetical protein